jgi:hypothetical protein
VAGHRSYVPDFGVYIKIQGTNGGTEYRSLSRQLVLFCVERRKAWRMLQSKAGVENREYKAQRSLLADVDAGRVSKDDLFAHGEELLKARIPGAAGHKPAEKAPHVAEPKAPQVAVDPAVVPPPQPGSGKGASVSVSS